MTNFQGARWMTHRVLAFILVTSLAGCKTRDLSVHTISQIESAGQQRRAAASATLIGTAVFFGMGYLTSNSVEGFLYEDATSRLKDALIGAQKTELMISRSQEQLSEIRAILNDSTGGYPLRAPSISPGAEIQNPGRFLIPMPAWISPYPDGAVRIIRDKSDPALSDAELSEIQEKHPELAKAASISGFSTDQVSQAKLQIKGQSLSVSNEAGNEHKLEVKNGAVQLSEPGLAPRSLVAHFKIDDLEIKTVQGDMGSQSKGSQKDELAAAGNATPSFADWLKGLRDNKEGRSADLPLTFELHDAASGQTKWIFKTSVVYPSDDSEPLIRFDADLTPSFLPQSVNQEFSLIIPIKDVLAVVEGNVEDSEGNVLIGSMEEFSADYIALVNTFYAKNPELVGKASQQLESQIKIEKKQLDAYKKALSEAPPIRNSGLSRLFFIIAVSAAVGAAGNEIGYLSVQAKEKQIWRWFRSSGLR